MTHDKTIVATAYWRGNQYHTSFHCKNGSEQEFDCVEFVPAKNLTAAQAEIERLKAALKSIESSAKFNSLTCADGDAARLAHGQTYRFVNYVLEAGNR